MKDENDRITVKNKAFNDEVSTKNWLRELKKMDERDEGTWYFISPDTVPYQSPRSFPIQSESTKSSIPISSHPGTAIASLSHKHLSCTQSSGPHLISPSNRPAC
jgi:hypothetical protein